MQTPSSDLLPWSITSQTTTISWGGRITLDPWRLAYHLYNFHVSWISFVKVEVSKEIISL